MNKPLGNVIATLVESCVDQGVVHVVGSPGSRSTPLAFGFHAHPSIQLKMITDERSAAFYALGLAKKSKEPVLLFCTSGSAVANYLPAIVEAFHSEIPLIVLTADRPHMLHDVGAPQTMRQHRIFQDYTRYTSEIVAYNDEKETLRYVSRSIMRSILHATGHTKGPVHLNIPFQEPLVPDLSEVRWQKKKKADRKNVLLSSNIDLCEISHEQLHSNRGLILLGETEDNQLMQAVLTLAEKFQIPICCDVLSNARQCNCSSQVTNYDFFLRNKALWDDLRPHWIVRIGKQPVSKVLMEFVAYHQDVYQLILSESERTHDWIHTHHESRTNVTKNSIHHLQQYVVTSDFAWSALWKKQSTTIESKVQCFLTENNENELWITDAILRAMPRKSTLFLANSMPIRYGDMLLSPKWQGTDVFANRGVNGIDGTIATSFGVAASSEETWCVLGDLAALHDFTSFLYFAQDNVKMTFILINNDGGGIFSYLPQAKQKEQFETLFGTPHGYTLTPLLQSANIDCQTVTDGEYFERVLQQPYQGIRVFEVCTNRVSSHAEITELTSQISNGE
ncbi:MAG: 2-succinyl-5-enolpyruvyl-6-hydroxy-3-cyclohexene-1-carboxylic-acid synthase [Bacilli bacterium]